MILVTGASGFIGTYVLKELSQRGIKCLAMCRSVLDQKNSSKVEWIEQNIEVEISKENISRIEECDQVIHLAWQGLPQYKELFHIEKNLMSQYYFLKQIINLGVTDVSITGTCLEYGLKEGCFSVEDVSNPFSSYAIAKDCLRKMVGNLLNKEDEYLKWIRLFYIYGEGQASYTLYGQLASAIHHGDRTFNMSKGDQMRDYLEVQEVAKYIVDVSFQAKYSGIFNCCSEEPVSIKEFVQSILKNNNWSIDLNLGYYPYPDYEPMAFWGKQTKILS